MAHDMFGREARREDRLKGLGVSTDAEAIALLSRLLDRITGAGEVLHGLQDRLKAAPDSLLGRAAELARSHGDDAFDELWSMRKTFQRHETRDRRRKR